MPELPEVEVTKRGVAPHVTGARIEQVVMGKPLRWPLGVSPDELAGRHVREVHRRGKYLLFELDKGWLMVHLGMSGTLRWVSRSEPLQKHEHVVLHFSAGDLRLHDPRRFGAVIHAHSLSDPLPTKLLSKLGVEPLVGWADEPALVSALKSRRTPIKQVLLGGDWVVGVGNIYASEVLFLSGIRPTTSAARLSRPRIRRLLQAIQTVLHQAVALGGSSIQDFVDSDGHSGEFQNQARVYGRAGQACHDCGTVIRRLVQGQRATYYCPQCQKP